jgi:glutamate-1-semialdehyde 2,1-aminomutase
MFQIFFTGSAVVDYESAKRSDASLFMKFFRELLKEGVFVPPSQFETCFVSYSHGNIDLERTVAAIERSLKAVRP